MRAIRSFIAVSVSSLSLALGFLSVGAQAQEYKSTAIDAKTGTVSLNFYDEPKTLDAQKATDAIAMMILGHASEGLTRLDPSDKPFAAQAESWEMKDKTNYTFKIRKGALWSDGKQVTAHDFVYSWRRAVDPKTASEYAFILYAVKNAEAINSGKMPADKLGAKAVDDFTLVVELERPTEYFLKLTAFSTYLPAREDIVKKFGESYAADHDKLLYNGPYVITSWNHNASIVLQKNDKYWNKAKIMVNTINMPYVIKDKNSEFNMFKDGKFAITWSMTKELLPEAQKSKMQIRKYNTGTVWYLQFNTTRAVTGNKNFRKALQLAMNREEYVKQVEGTPGTKPIYGLIPEYMPGVKKRYGEEFPLKFADAQIDAAKKHLELAKKELNLKEFPELSILASDADNVRRDMEYFQRYFKEKLGLKFKLEFHTFKVRLEKTSSKNFDIVNSGWGPDYLDPMTFADLFTSWNQNNNSGWSSKEYDRLIKTAMDSTDSTERLKLMSDSEKILVEDAPIAPYFQAFRLYVQDNRLQGVLRRTVGPDPDFYYAKIADKAGK